MLENRLRLTPISSIDFPESRWRKQINYSKLLPLALNITQVGLLQPIGIDSENSTLAFGGRRYHAFLLIQAALGRETSVTFPFKPENLEEIRASAESNPLYEDWTKIPCRVGRGLSQLTLQSIEFVENIREDLSWQENSEAAIALHQAAKEEKLAEGIIWSEAQTAALLGLSRSYLSELLRPHRQIEALPSELRHKAASIIKEAPSASRAATSIKDMAERHGYQSKPAGPRITLTKPKEESTPISEPKIVTHILCADFRKWVKSYSGPKFNFVHCDFPYGIDYNKSGGQDSNLALRQVGKYDDDPNVYWSLLDTLTFSRKKLLADSCHIMFWLSPKHLDRTRVLLESTWPDAHISPFPLIWHCSDNSGLMPDPRREPRHTYEMAIKITLGDRPLAKGKAGSVAYPRNQDTKIHRSQKHLAVLTHFFELFVDGSTRMLDPTCGSGMAVLAARKLGAQSTVGLELDLEMCTLANKMLTKELS